MVCFWPIAAVWLAFNSSKSRIKAKARVASLHQLSGGRFMFAIGGGWNVEEMENHGARYDTRFKLLRERVLAMKAPWTQEEAEFHGEFVNLDPVWLYPKCAVARLRLAANAAGRDPATLSITVFNAPADAAALAAYREAGFERVLLEVPDLNRDEVLRVLDKNAPLAKARGASQERRWKIGDT